MISNNINNINNLNNLNNVKNIDNSKNKIINSVCHCKTSLQWKKLEVIMLDPCEHLIHKKCFESLNTDSCPFCKTKVSLIVRLRDYKKNPNLFQKCVDILSQTNTDELMKISYDDAILNIPEIILTTVRSAISKGTDEGHKLIKDLLKTANVKIKVSGLEKIKKGPKVFIANHTCYLDFMAIFYVLKTGFASSSTIKNNPLTEKISKIVPTYFIEIGKSSNAVKGMKKYIEDNGSICLFPEGMFSHNITLTRFRTGAFYIGYPVYPIVLKYKNYMSDTSLFDFVLKTHSEKSECIEFTVLDPFYPPFDEKKIELVRFAMAEAGKLLIARTSNRDVNNTKNKK